MRYKIGIVAAAVGIDKKVTERFANSIAEHSRDYYLKIINEFDYGKHNPAAYNVSRAKNIGIRDCLSKDCPIIICTDIDYIVPPGLVDYCIENTGAKLLYVLRRDINEAEAAKREWEKWLNIPTFDVCYGSWNSMSAENWRRVGGWDERCFGWGFEDDILHMRIKRAGIEKEIIKKFPLMHIEHPPRSFRAQGDRREKNMNFSKGGQPNYLSAMPVAQKPIMISRLHQRKPVLISRLRR